MTLDEIRALQHRQRIACQRVFRQMAAGATMRDHQRPCRGATHRMVTSSSAAVG